MLDAPAVIWAEAQWVAEGVERGHKGLGCCCMLQPQYMAKFMSCNLQQVCAWKREAGQQYPSPRHTSQDPESSSGTMASAHSLQSPVVPSGNGLPGHTLVVPNSPGLIKVEVDVPFSVGFGEEGVGQDAPRPIKRQVVPMPVAVGG